jgi:hypothetical protein
LATSTGSLPLILRVELARGPTHGTTPCPVVHVLHPLSLSYLLLSAFPATEQSQRLSPPSPMKPPRRCPPCFSFPRPRQGSPPSFPKRRPAKDRASLAAPPWRTATPYFCYNHFATLPYFLLRCYISTKNLLRRLRRGLRQNHFTRKNCSDATLAQKFCSDVSGEIRCICFEPFFATMKQNRGFFFCFTEAISGS